MIPVAFDYERASTIDDAIAKLGGGGKAIAGGHSLVPLMKLRLSEPGKLVDISRIPGLSGIKESGGRIEIGATTTHADIAASKLLRDTCPMLAEAAAEIGDPQVRNRGTLGGSIAHADRLVVAVGLHHEERATDVGGEHGVEKLGRGVQDRAAVGQRACVDQNIDPPEAGIGRGDHLCAGVRAAKIGLHEEGRDRKAIGQCPAPVGVASGHHEPRRTRRRQPSRYRRAQTLRRAGDDADLAIHPIHLTP